MKMAEAIQNITETVIPSLATETAGIKLFWFFVSETHQRIFLFSRRNADIETLLA